MDPRPTELIGIESAKLGSVHNSERALDYERPLVPHISSPADASLNPSRNRTLNEERRRVATVETDCSTRIKRHINTYR